MLWGSITCSTVPIFNCAFGDNRILVHREFIKYITNIALTSMIVNYLITGKVDLFATRIFVSMQWNVGPGAIETMADFYDYWLGHPAIANQMRHISAFIGMRAHPGSSSTFINIDAFS